MHCVKPFCLTTLLLTALPAWSFDCFPVDTLGYPIPFATGSPAVTVRTPAGQAGAWWCLLPRTADTPADTVQYSFNAVIVLDKYKDLAKLAAAAMRVATATDSRVQLDAEIKAATVIPAAGSMDEYQFRLLRYNVCLELAKPPYTVPIYALPADYCGAAPVPPAASPDGTSIPPAASILDATGVTWTIASTTYATRDGVPTNGRATELLLKGGAIYAKSPTGGIWWKWTGSNTWQKLTTTRP